LHASGDVIEPFDRTPKPQVRFLTSRDPSDPNLGEFTCFGAGDRPARSDQFANGDTELRYVIETEAEMADGGGPIPADR